MKQRIVKYKYKEGECKIKLTLKEYKPQHGIFGAVLEMNQVPKVTAIQIGPRTMAINLQGLRKKVICLLLQLCCGLRFPVLM